MNHTRKEQLAKEVIESLPLQERIAIAYGIPIPNTSDFSNFMSADGDGLDDESYETSVNGEWDELKENPMMDFDGDEESFDDFLTKKSRSRIKRKRAIKKDLKSQGIKGKEMRKTARKQALKEIPRDSLKTIAKNTLGKIGRGIAVTTMFIPRSSFLSLLAINFRGLAWKLSQGLKDPSNKEKILAKWYKLGGKQSSLEKTIRSGEKKKAFFCGKKCKEKLAEKGATRSKFSGFNAKEQAKELISQVEYIDEYDNVGGIDDAAIAVWVGVGTAVIGAMTGVVSSVKMSKQKDAEIKNAQVTADKEIALMSEKTKREADLVEQQIKLQADPIKSVLANPNLSSEQKKEAIAVIKDATSVDDDASGGSKTKKYLIIGGAILGAIVVLGLVFKGKRAS